MQSREGGTVRYVELSLLECPEEPGYVGECTKRGRIEVLSRGAVRESFDVFPGSKLWVADGDTVSRHAWLFDSPGWVRSVRADIPAGVEAFVRWSAVTGTRVDEVTGLSELYFPHGERDVQLDLLDREGRALRRSTLPGSAKPVVAQGAVVSRGALLARIYAPAAHAGIGGVDALRAFLDVRICPRGSAAAISPCDGRVEGIELGFFILRARDGRVHRVRKSQSHLAYGTARVGDLVCAGDALEDGRRSHHRLLRVWGEDRLAQHMLEELERETAMQGLDIARAYWALVVKTMLGWRRILDGGDTGFARHQIVPRQAFERVQGETAARGATLAKATPALRGIASIARERRASLRRK